MRYSSYARATQGLNTSSLEPCHLPGASMDVEGGQVHPEDIIDNGTAGVSSGPGGSDERRVQREGWRETDKGRGRRLAGEAAKQRNNGPRAPRPSRNGASGEVPSEAAGLKRELEALRKELDSTKVLLRVRSAELRGVQSFLDTSDKTPLADVRRTVEKLNAEIFQLSAALADSFTYTSEIPACAVEEEHAARSRLKDAGSAGISGLPRVPCGPVEYGMEQWYHTRNGISDINQEHPSVGRRWRALSFKHSIHHAAAHDVTPVISIITRDITDILSIAGIEPASGDIEALVREQACTKLQGFLETIGAIQRMFYEDVFSCDLKLDVPRCCQRFNKETMEELCGETSKAVRSPLRMLCAVGVGLWSRDALSEDSSQSTVLLKAKVVTDEVVQSVFVEGRIKDGAPRNAASRGHPANRGPRRGRYNNPNYSNRNGL